MTNLRLWRGACAVIFLASSAGTALAADNVQTRDGVKLSVGARTPEQIEAFYSARGFTRAGLKALREVCFFTVGIHNDSADVVWLELQNFTISDEAGKRVARITRPQWKKRLTQLKVPLASQSAFGWTQLPEQRDLQPDEPVGGNFAIPRHSGPLSLTITFRRPNTSPLSFEFPDLHCAD